jgi:hypothetical protein
VSHLALAHLAAGKSLPVTHRWSGSLVRAGLAESKNGWLQLTPEGQRLADEHNLFPLSWEMRAWRLLARRPTTTPELAEQLGCTDRWARMLVADMRRRGEVRCIATRWPGRVPVWLARRAA